MSDNDLVQWLAERFDRLESKMDELGKVSAKQEVKVEAQESAIREVRGEIVPLRDAHARTRGAIWVIGVLAGAVGVWATVKELMA